MTTIDPEPQNVIYGLFAMAEPDRIRYIGLTTQGLKTRLAQHRSDGDIRARLPVHLWIKKHGRDNIGARVLATAETVAELAALEMRLIAEHGGDRDELLNRTDGGEGPNGYVYTDEHREKQRRARLGYVHSEETKRKMSASALSSWEGNEGRREKARANTQRLEKMREASVAAVAKLREDPEWEAQRLRKQVATLLSRPDSLRSMALAHARFTEAEVLEIRRRSDAGESRSALGREYDTSPSTISGIARRKTWRHLPEEPLA